MSVFSVFAVAPALPLHTAGKYVAGAYIVFLAIVLIYVGIMATRLSRTERELIELRRDVEAQRALRDSDRDPGRDPGHDPGHDPGRGPGHDPGRGPGHDPGHDPGREREPVA